MELEGFFFQVRTVIKSLLTIVVFSICDETGLASLKECNRTIHADSSAMNNKAMEVGTHCFLSIFLKWWWLLDCTSFSFQFILKFFGSFKGHDWTQLELVTIGAILADAASLVLICACMWQRLYVLYQSLWSAERHETGNSSWPGGGPRRYFMDRVEIFGSNYQRV